jgi:hypothetical protein
VAPPLDRKRSKARLRRQSAWWIRAKESFGARRQPNPPFPFSGITDGGKLHKGVFVSSEKKKPKMLFFHASREEER